MRYTIKNDKIKVEIDSMGAELMSVQSADGTEYLWQGDAKYWKGHAPNLFPYIARLTNETYTLDGKEYHMLIHGFVKRMELTAEDITEQSITFRLDSCEETMQQYPFRFSYFITYAAEGNVLKISHRVENHDDKRMYFGIGGHPGFNVPLEDGLSFEDYVLEFDHKCYPTQVDFTEDIHVSGKDSLYILEDDIRIPLKHDLFALDAVVLKNADRAVTIKSAKGTRAVKVCYPDYKHVGFWHMPRTDAPYVCVEPWSSLPSRAGVVEDFAQQSDLVYADAGETYKNVWTIEII